jgi:hypothetical protein
MWTGPLLEPEGRLIFGYPFRTSVATDVCSYGM